MLHLYYARYIWSAKIFLSSNDVFTLEKHKSMEDWDNSEEYTLSLVHPEDAALFDRKTKPKLLIVGSDKRIIEISISPSFHA